jgi:hypothetical protein
VCGTVGTKAEALHGAVEGGVEFFEWDSEHGASVTGWCCSAADVFALAL